MKAASMLVAGMVLLSVLTPLGKADTFGFRPLEGTNPELAGQFSVDVTSQEGNTGAVEFSFHNDVPGNDQPGYCSITDIYFYGQDLIVPPPTIIDQMGCDFTMSPTTPLNLPGWHTAPTALVYSIGIQGNPTQGLDRTADKLTFAFALNDEENGFDQLIEDLYSGAFVVGLKVQAIWPCDNSATFVTPVPAAALLGMLGLTTAGMKLRKFV